MLFLQATQSPVAVIMGDIYFKVPKFTIDQIIDWSNEIAEERFAKATAEMDESRIREYRTFYPPVAPDFNEMRRIVITPEGTKKVLLDQMPRADAFENDEGKPGKPLDRISIQQVLDIIAVNGTGRLSGVAWAVADLNDNAKIDPNAPPAMTETGGADPLMQGAKPAPTRSRTTGTKTSHSSTSSTAPESGGDGRSPSSPIVSKSASE